MQNALQAHILQIVSYILHCTGIIGQICANGAILHDPIGAKSHSNGHR
jgi:hypothetical protein